MSSTCSSMVGAALPGTGSDRPTPRLSYRMSRLNGRQPAYEPRQQWLHPLVVHVRVGPGLDHQQVRRPAAQYLVRQMDGAIARIAGLWRSTHTPIVKERNLQDLRPAAAAAHSLIRPAGLGTAGSTSGTLRQRLRTGRRLTPGTGGKSPQRPRWARPRAQPAQAYDATLRSSSRPVMRDAGTQSGPPSGRYRRISDAAATSARHEAWPPGVRAIRRVRRVCVRRISGFERCRTAQNGPLRAAWPILAPLHGTSATPALIPAQTAGCCPSSAGLRAGFGRVMVALAHADRLPAIPAGHRRRGPDQDL